ncbi:MAG: DNA polymerase III subunit delta [Lactobacillaceae bacterium]|jgi:DNA polymerase-3 subunit delta|nr:DNA polymerase III subunit delta [Lactobacillaceae bacterium]
MQIIDFLTNRQSNIPSIILLKGEERYYLNSFFIFLKSSLEVEQRNDNFISIDNDIHFALNELQEFSLFGGRKIIILNDPLFLTAKESLDKDKEKQLLLYLKNPNLDNIFVINAIELTIDKRKKINKLIESQAFLIEFNQLDEKQIFRLTKNKFKKENIDINDDNITHFLAKIGYDLSLLDLNIKKLIAFGKTEQISLSAINSLITKNSQETIFTLSEYINKSEIKKAIPLYKELIDQGQSPIAIIGLLLSQYRLYIQVALSSQSEQELASFLSKHPYRIKLARKQTYGIDSRILFSKYLQLSKIDYQLKTTSIDSIVLFQMFLID